MLISFSVENFRSIRDKVTLQITPSSSIKDHEDSIIETGNEYFPEVLPVVSIYGSNGSGKSTLLKAANFMRFFVLTSARESMHGDKIGVEPFLLDAASSEKPTTFSMDFLIDHVRYVYTFSVTTDRVTYETLHSYPRRAKQVWFERVYSEAVAEYSWSFSSQFFGDKFTIRDKTLDNTLFLSKAVMDNDPQIKPVYDFFRLKLAVSFGTHDPHLTYEYFQTDEGREKVLNFLRAADLSIDEISVKKIDKGDLPAEVRNFYGTTYDTKSIHRIPGSSQLVTFDFEKSESTGTVKMFRMAGLIIRTLANGGTLFLDELEQGLHFKLQHFIICLFNKAQLGHRRAQLVFTTHSALILEESMLRRDQIWFTNKTPKKNTILYSLVDVPKTIKGAKPVRRGQSLIRGYLEGRFYDAPKIIEDQLSLFTDDE